MNLRTLKNLLLMAAFFVGGQAAAAWTPTTQDAGTTTSSGGPAMTGIYGGGWFQDKNKTASASDFTFDAPNPAAAITSGTVQYPTT
ncbi:hypothetical protein Dxin01_03930 [Deinococcus xinjiangensis]|uniref:Uncharacterized protein n=1 Tax=Deinococcus xinjiangensis TaxID=457454 RepID=A0ABP9VHE8_9DEIO